VELQGQEREAYSQGYISGVSILTQWTGWFKERKRVAGKKWEERD
jgi:hypothetical protein